MGGGVGLLFAVTAVVEVCLQSDKVGVCGKQQHLNNCRWVAGSCILYTVILFVTLDLLLFVTQINILML